MEYYLGNLSYKKIELYDKAVVEFGRNYTGQLDLLKETGRRAWHFHWHEWSAYFKLQEGGSQENSRNLNEDQ